MRGGLTLMLYKKTVDTLVECLLWARFGAKCFTYTISLNCHGNLRAKDWFPHFTDGETEAS